MTIKELTNLLKALSLSARHTLTPRYFEGLQLTSARYLTSMPHAGSAPAVKCEAEDDWGKQELSRHHVGNGSRK
jgi:hypothetical protein